MKRIAIAALITAAVVLGGAHGCQGTDPSPNPLKPCPIGQVRWAANIKPPFQYKGYPDAHTTTAHQKKRQ